MIGANGEPESRRAIEARVRGLPVFLPWSGKTLFEVLPSSWGFDLRRGFPTPDLEAGVIVVPFPFSTRLSFLNKAFSELTANWSEGLSAAARGGRIRIVLDASAEGFEHSDARSDGLHQALEQLGMSRSRAIVVTQERNYPADYARYLAKRRLHDGARVLNYDLWIKRYHAQFEANGERIHERRAKRFRNRRRIRGRRFVSLNMTVRPSKLPFLLSLIRDDLWDAGYVSFGGLYRKASQFHPEHEQRLEAASLEDRFTQGTRFQTLGKELAPYLPQLEAKDQVIFGDMERDPDTGLARKSPIRAELPEYDDSWFSVVTETEMRNRPSRITEKPFAAMNNFHPFIMFGNPGALAQVRELGYQTFGDCIDESYDQIEEPELRFRAAYEQFLWLCRMSDRQLMQLERRLSETLQFNARWGLTQLPAIYRDRLDTELLARMFAD